MAMQSFRSKINPKSDRFLRNKEEMQVLIDELQSHLTVAKTEGSKASIDRARKRKKFLARERIQLTRQRKSFYRADALGGLAPRGWFCPGGTTVAGVGYVNKRLCTATQISAHAKQELLIMPRA